MAAMEMHDQDAVKSPEEHRRSRRLWQPGGFIPSEEGLLAQAQEPGLVITCGSYARIVAAARGQRRASCGVARVRFAGRLVGRVVASFLELLARRRRLDHRQWSRRRRRRVRRSTEAKMALSPGLLRVLQLHRASWLLHRNVLEHSQHVSRARRFTTLTSPPHFVDGHLGAARVARSQGIETTPREFESLRA